MTDYARQARYDVRFEWDLVGLQAIAVDDPVAIIVDVLSFSTAVSVALSRGATVLPFPWSGDRAVAYARRRDALLAGSRASGAYSLSPVSLRGLSAQARIVLPSANGSRICFDAPCSRVLTGCLRNRRGVVGLAASLGCPIAVIAAGERWPDGSLRPAMEDLLGAGAIIAQLSGTRSPEAELAASAFQAQTSLPDALRRCASGLELSNRGFAEDVAMASELDVDDQVSLLSDRAFAPR